MIAHLPTVGIFAFALASVWSLFQLFNNSALHPTPLYWIPAALVELVTAWLAYQAVEAVRKVTRSNISKQDRRFARIIFVLCVVLSIPTLAVSFTANRYEFQGNVGLSLLFPVSCIACAVASAIPHIKAQVVSGKVAGLRNENNDLRAQVRKLEQLRAMREPTRADYDELCAGLNGNTPQDARSVNRLLQDNGYYARPDATARSWCERST